MLPLLVLALQTSSIDLTYLASGMSQIGGFSPKRLALSAARPTGLKKEPGLVAPRYGKIELGGREYLVAVGGKPDAPEGDSQGKIFVDTNHNGDLTDDAPVDWRKFVVYNDELKKEEAYGEGEAWIRVPIEGRERLGRVNVSTEIESGALNYYGDYGYYGSVTLGGKRHAAFFWRADGLYPVPAADERPHMGRLGIDLADQGTNFSSFPALIPGVLSLADRRYEIRGSFGALKLVAKVDLKPGAACPRFQARTLGGAKVAFPGAYKGKLVLLNFWATWCAPCVAELPGLVKRQRELKARGFEVLSVSLDEAKNRDLVGRFVAKAGMAWPQIHGKDAQAISGQYDVQTIPQAYLVDGDTGKIVAAGDSLRGEDLFPTLLKALKEKGR